MWRSLPASSNGNSGSRVRSRPGGSAATATICGSGGCSNGLPSTAARPRALVSAPACSLRRARCRTAKGGRSASASDSSRRAAQLVHQRPAHARAHQHLGAAGRAVAVRVLARLIDVERVMGVLDERHRQPARDQPRDRAPRSASSCRCRTSRRSRKRAWTTRVRRRAGARRATAPPSRDAAASAARPACTIAPSQTMTPARARGRPSSAGAMPASASARTYGSVAAASANVAVRATSAGMFGHRVVDDALVARRSATTACVIRDVSAMPPWSMPTSTSAEPVPHRAHGGARDRASATACPAPARRR